MRPPRRPAPAGGRQRALRIRGRLMHIKTKMKLRDRSLASPRNFFTPGARPATASAAAPRSQATSPMLPLSLCARGPLALRMPPGSHNHPVHRL